MDESKGQAGGVLTPVARQKPIGEGVFDPNGKILNLTGFVKLTDDLKRQGYRVGPVFDRPTPAAAADLLLFKPTPEMIDAGQAAERFGVAQVWREMLAASPVAPAGAPRDLPQKTMAVDIVLNMCREANMEAKLPTPACWDLALYVSKLEALLHPAAPQSSVPVGVHSGQGGENAPGAEPPGAAVMTALVQQAAQARCPRCGLPQSECDFQRNFPDPEPM